MLDQHSTMMVTNRRLDRLFDQPYLGDSGHNDDSLALSFLRLFFCRVFLGVAHRMNKMSRQLPFQDWFVTRVTDTPVNPQGESITRPTSEANTSPRLLNLPGFAPLLCIFENIIGSVQISAGFPSSRISTLYQVALKISSHSTVWKIDQSRKLGSHVSLRCLLYLLLGADVPGLDPNTRPRLTKGTVNLHVVYVIPFHWTATTSNALGNIDFEMSGTKIRHSETMLRAIRCPQTLDFRQCNHQLDSAIKYLLLPRAQ